MRKLWSLPTGLNFPNFYYFYKFKCSLNVFHHFFKPSIPRDYSRNYKWITKQSLMASPAEASISKTLPGGRETFPKKENLIQICQELFIGILVAVVGLFLG